MNMKEQNKMNLMWLKWGKKEFLDVHVVMCDRFPFMKLKKTKMIKI